MDADRVDEVEMAELHNAILAFTMKQMEQLFSDRADKQVSMSNVASLAFRLPESSPRRGATKLDPRERTMQNQRSHALFC
jgi:hypothetical protein